MEWDAIAKNWKRVRVLAQAKWPWMTDADLDAIAGDRTKLDAKIAAEHGISVQEARHQSQEFGLKVEAAPGDAKVEVKPAPKAPAPNPGTGHS